MSVILKGTEMPDCCGLCYCFHPEHPMYCQAVKVDITKKISAPYGKPRPDWCPLVEIPEGARLIDAEALYMDIIHRFDYCDDFLEMLDEAPTVFEED